MNVMVTKSYICQTQATVCQNEIKTYQGKSSQNELLFSFAYEQKGATNYDKAKRENPRGLDRRDRRLSPACLDERGSEGLSEKTSRKREK